jgi:hypothetical protein
MGVSESIIAASIGATATVSAAIFQLYTALRVKSRIDQRRRRTTTVRSAAAIVALMIVSAAGGYLFAEFRLQHAIDDVRTVHEELRGMRDEVNAELQTLTKTAEHLTPARGVDSEPLADVAATLLAAGCEAEACDEARGARVALCATVPQSAQVGEVDLYVGDAPALASGEPAELQYRRVQFDEDSGGVKFTGAPFELARNESGRTLCVDFVHWSREPHFARMAVQLVPTTNDVTHLAEANTP